MISADVVIIGAGNAGLCAALAALENGASVIVLERAPERERGGNTAFTAGAMRVAYEGVTQLAELLPDLPDADRRRTDFGRYPEAEFFDDLARLSKYRANPDLLDILASQSYDVLSWMQGHGVRFAPMYGRQAYLIDGRFTFWGGLVIEAVGGGKGLVDALSSAVQRNGGQIMYGARAVELISDGGSVEGVLVGKRKEKIAARSVILASGGFEANAEWRARYLGPDWDLARVRGTRYNTGDGLRMALELGATACGHWSGCHAVAWELNSPEYGDLAVGDAFQKHSYPLGVMINARGDRFLDEGADFRNYTYAQYGRVILRQPAQFAWQVFDNKVLHLLSDDYRIREVTRVRADSLDELASKLDGVDPERFIQTVKAFNSSVKLNVPFNPNVRDGRSTQGIDPPKSNWANPLDSPPFEAYAVTAGITFTFGGLRITPRAEVVVSYEPAANLFAAGELVGGLFYFNYPGGAGLTGGSVFGRLAGQNAASVAQTSVLRKTRASKKG